MRLLLHSITCTAGIKCMNLHGIIWNENVKEIDLFDTHVVCFLGTL